MTDYKKRGYFDEHIIPLQSLIFGQPFIYSDTYLIYHNPLNKKLWIDLFMLGEEKDKIRCVLDSLSRFKPTDFIISSPEKIQISLKDYTCTSIFFDKDYQIELEKFDEKLRGEFYKDLRYAVNSSNRHNYNFSISKKFSLSHMFILASHMTKKIYNVWDYQTYLKIEEFIKRFKSSMLFNVFSNKQLIGFDIVDTLNDTICTPYGFYMKNEGLADFLMYKEVLYAKENGFKWLDVGWGCNEGLENFKRKWKAIPRFEIYLQEYVKV